VTVYLLWECIKHEGCDLVAIYQSKATAQRERQRLSWARKPKSDRYFRVSKRAIILSVWDLDKEL
jgi:hypothetical protein